MSSVVKTATSAAMCACCGGGTLATLTSRERGGTATLCGNSENVGFVSTPPKKYRRKRVSGTMLVCNSAAPCTTPSTSTQQSQQYIYDNGNDYNALSCAVVAFNLNHTILCSQTGPPPPPICQTSTGCNPAGIVQPIDVWKITTGASHACFSVFGINGSVVFGPPTFTNSVQVSVSLSNFCCGNGGTPTQTTSGTITELLTVEDTDADAYARAVPGFTWSSYSGGTTSRICTMGVRTTGFSFTLVDVEFQVDASGYSPGSTHTVTVEVWRAVAGSGVYSLFQTLTYNPTADGSGNISFNDFVPNATGFDSYVTNPRVF